jgi:predicted nucleic acid-binding protein
MSGNIFFFLYIIVYARVASVRAKHEKVKLLFESHANDNIFVSTQVLSETYNALKKNGVDEPAIQKTINECIIKMNIISVDVGTIQHCLKIKNRYGFSYWDSLILSAAFLGNCTIVYSEDMKHEQIIFDTVKIINPFYIQPI